MMIVAAIVRLVLCVMFARAAWHKFQDRTRFQAELAAYQLLPAALLPLAVPALIALELSAVLLLPYPANAAGLWFASAILLAYASAMAINIVQGRTHIDCGCSANRKTVSWALVTRNLVLAAVALLSCAAPRAGFTANTLLLALAGSACALLIHEAIGQALANAQHYRAWLTRQAVKP